MLAAKAWGVEHVKQEQWPVARSEGQTGGTVRWWIVTRRDTDSMPGSDSRPLARQGTVTAALWLMQDEVCGREEWTGEGKANDIKSQGQETQLGVIGTPRHGINTCQDATMSS